LKFIPPVSIVQFVPANTRTGQSNFTTLH